MQNAFWVDGRGQPILDSTLPVFVDGAALASPVASDTTLVTLLWPAESIRLTVYAPDADVWLTDDGATQRFVIPKGSCFQLPGRAGRATQLLRPSATSVQFCFEVL